MKILVLLLLALSFSSAQPPDWQPVESILGKQGIVENDVLKGTFPRSDLKVNVGEVQIAPALALTSWIAFQGMGGHTMIMGDLVLLDSELARVLPRLVESGIEVSALHNHIVGESPRVMYLHFGVYGDASELAKAMRSVLSVTATPLSAPQLTQQSSEQDWSTVESILGWTGQRKGTVLQIGVPRSETITENGMVIPPFMGMLTAINFQSVNDKVATTGDFVLLGGEVNPVVKALTESGITVTAIHNHMLFESPRLFFLHFWGFDGPEKLAHGLKAALDKTNSREKK